MMGLQREARSLRNRLSSARVRALLSARISACALGLLAIPVAQPLMAAPFDPVIELFRLGAGDHLVIDRGGPVDQAGDVNGDGLDDVIVAAGIGGVRVVFGPTNGDDGVLNAASLSGTNGFVINGDGPHVSGLGDINDDGVDDVIVGSATATYVVFGQTTGFERQVDVNTLDGSNGFVIATPATGVSDAGDINNDGIADLLVSNADAPVGTIPSAGSTYLVFGRSTGFPATLDPASLNGDTGSRIDGIAAGDRSGLGLGAAGDFNADGIDDFLIGAPAASREGLTEVGEAYLIYGTTAGYPARISLADLDERTGLIMRGSRFEQALGTAVTTVGDINRDGYGDIAIGAPGKGPFGAATDYPGEAYVLFGGAFRDAAVLDRSMLDGTNGFRVHGIRGGVLPIQEGQPTWGDMAGQAIDIAGDVNGDGLDDMVIGASQTIINPQRKGNGQTYIVYGSASAFPADFFLNDLDGASGFRLNGIGTTDYSGFSVSKAGDFNADGIDDVILGASGQGNSYVFYGRQTGTDFVGAVPLTVDPSTPAVGSFPPAAIANPPTTPLPPMDTPTVPEPQNPPSGGGAGETPIQIPVGSNGGAIHLLWLLLGTLIATRKWPRQQ